MNSSDDEGRSSTSRSVSRSPSPALSLEEEQEHSPPTLERLVLYFVSAKRSLASTTQVYRANELVTHSRSLIEEIAVLSAKNSFSRKALLEGLDTLTAVRDAVLNEDEQIAADFESKVLKLDAAHDRLSKTLDGLRATIVAAQTHTSPSDQDEAEEKTLYDFIEATEHENIIASIREGIDSYHARHETDGKVPLADLTSRLKDVSTALSTIESESQTADKTLRMKPTTIYSRKPPGSPEGIHGLFQTLSEHAQTMASLLSQLVKHYDLCVSALKHTEGGGEAARIAQEEDGQTAADDSLYANRFEPMDQEEREAMLKVLVGDAGEVEDVISEMSELSQGMETAYDDIVARAETARSEHRSLGQILKKLTSIRTAIIPSLLQTAGQFSKTFYPELEAKMRADVSAMMDLVQFYEDYQRGYGALLKEVRRRDVVAERTRAVAEKAQRELDRLYEQDRDAREGFAEEARWFIPRDLGERFGMEEKGVRFVVREEE